MRDHARLLDDELEREGVACRFHWLERTETSFGGARSEVRGWARRISGELREERPDVVLLHYSVFSYSYKGVPLLVRPVLAALRDVPVPVIAVMHELAFPWRYDGARGEVWALTQRMVLRDLIGSASGVIVTADFRAEWLSSRRWLPRRRVLVAPVFPTIPPPRNAPAASHGRVGGEERVIGVFGYAYQGAALSLVLDAVHELGSRGLRTRLRLLGAPGRASAAGEEWTAAAQERGVEDALSFSGRLPAQELSDELAACDVLVFPDATGPSSRKTTLAASLASGVPVVALDGLRTWGRLSGEHAARVVPPTSQALADALAELLQDDTQARELGVRGRAFAEREMNVAGTAAAVRTLLEDLPGRRRVPGRR